MIDRDVTVARVGALARRTVTGEVGPRRDAERLASLREALARKRRSWRTAPKVLAIAAVIALVVTGLLLRSPRDLRYEIEGATIRFSEGSVVTIEPGARARLGRVTPHGAAVLLEEGRVALEVTHLPGATWAVEAGAYRVNVIGTKLDVTWSAAEEVLRVRVREGSVRVDGPLAGGTPIEGGQEVVFRPRAPVPSAAESASAPTPPASGSSAPEAHPTPRVTASAAPVTRVGWKRRVAMGEYRVVLDEADERGVDGTLARADAEDLDALADAARYGGRADLSRRALEAERSRFPGSAEARKAPFFLGRLADDVDHAPRAAIRWYDEYLTESPAGAFAEEALGRKAIALRTLGQLEAAREAAREYLRRHPQGAYASALGDLGEP